MTEILRECVRISADLSHCVWQCILRFIIYSVEIALPASHFHQLATLTKVTCQLVKYTRWQKGKPHCSCQLQHTVYCIVMLWWGFLTWFSRYYKKGNQSDHNHSVLQDVTPPPPIYLVCSILDNKSKYQSGE